ncbi:MAG: respiratory nitrate reductase subunit gamma [Actinomycetia bacterium]|nr:respiratory nitrate reductase subunit gamma [Actinomycetes bacterium]
MSETLSVMLFVVLPYAALALAIIVSVLRWREAPFSISSLSTQLLESRKLFWGSIPFHWGIIFILTGHIFVLFLPSTVDWWNGVPLRLYALEITGVALALWALFGMVVLTYRRLSNSKVRRVTTPMDYVVLTILFVQIISGLWVAIGLRFGAAWATGVVVPYIWSLVVLQPKPELISPFPLVLQIHVVAFWVFLAVFPFTRLVHILTYPVMYVTKPWQKVVANVPNTKVR